MDRQSFVDGLIQAVRQSSIEGTLELNTRFNTLSAQDRTSLQSVVEKSVDSAIFGFLCVLDGVRAIEDGETKGNLELWYKGGEDCLLNNDDSEYLHDLYMAARPASAKM